MKFYHPSELRLWRTEMLLLSNDKGHKSIAIMLGTCWNPQKDFKFIRTYSHIEETYRTLPRKTLYRDDIGLMEKIEILSHQLYLFIFYSETSINAGTLAWIVSMYYFKTLHLVCIVRGISARFEKNGHLFATHLFFNSIED